MHRKALSTEHGQRHDTTSKTATDPDDALTRLLAQTCRKLGVREIVLRYLPSPSTVRWIATALIDHHCVVDKLRADIQGGGEIIFGLGDLGSYNDMPIAPGEGATPTDAIKAMTPVTWKAQKC